MTKAYVNVDTSISKNLKSCRKLESNVWNEYVANNDAKDLVAYHFAFTINSISASDRQPVENASVVFEVLRGKISYTPLCTNYPSTRLHRLIGCVRCYFVDKMYNRQCP